MVGYERRYFPFTGTISYTSSKETVSRNVTHILVLNPVLLLARCNLVPILLQGDMIDSSEGDVCIWQGWEDCGQQIQLSWINEWVVNDCRASSKGYLQRAEISCWVILYICTLMIAVLTDTNTPSCDSFIYWIPFLQSTCTDLQQLIMLSPSTLRCISSKFTPKRDRSKECGASLV